MRMVVGVVVSVAVAGGFQYCAHVALLNYETWV
jgi:hypothetical protein